jgi:hypothetical protein
MSNRLVGDLSRQQTRELRSAVPSTDLRRPRAWGQRDGARGDFRRLERAPFCLDGSNVVQRAGEAE